MLGRLIPDPFILMLLATVGLATLLPATGAAAHAVSSTATLAIVLLFFFHGAKLSREAVVQGLNNLKLHAMILGTSFLLFPLLSMAITGLAGHYLLPALVLGITYLSVLPSTVQSSIAFTSMARGNVPAAIASASASQVLGVFLTPMLVGLLAHRHGGDLGLGGLGNVLLIVLVPFIAGQLCRPLIGGWVAKHKSIVSISDRSAILLSVYSAFSDAVANHIWSRLPLWDLLLLALVCTVLLIAVLAFTWLLGRFAGLPLEDRIVLLFCGSKKSLVQGIPMARVLFAGPDLGLILLPLMIFHQIQLMTCAWIAGRIARKGREQDG